MTRITMQDIPRVKAGMALKVSMSDLDNNDRERFSLASRARDVLGYGGLIANVTGDVGQIVKAGKLAEALRLADIDVLELGTVLDYQLQESSRLTREFILEGNLDDWAAGGYIMSEARWSKTSLREYDHPVPEFVLDKALRIKEACPEVEFRIQHLNQPKADPFLVAFIGKEIYYIEVWDEPRFEGRVSR